MNVFISKCIYLGCRSVSPCKAATMPSGRRQKTAEKRMNQGATMDMKTSPHTWEDQETALKSKANSVMLEKKEAQGCCSRVGSMEKRPLPVTPGEYTEIKEEEPLYTEAQNVYEGCYMVPQSEKPTQYLTMD